MPETPAPAEGSDEPLCITHPKYGAVKPPQGACEGCWRAYLKEKFGERIAPLDTSRTITISDDPELIRFINDLQKARNKSKYGGGCYSAFFHGKEFVLQVDVHLSWNQE